ncbi:MAG TPA: metal ABC transporter ATP-binding protein [Thermoanaerobaculaceae bacterium]|nr:metal ABC transporter ATP-binding protein [Thermoanaerobaculaceae bacterium]HRS16263.1 metal ABC transporter ATP-binding protein [Thermoanaerobaculaceae bacterium]
MSRDHSHPLLRFDDVTLSYGGAPVLRRLSFHICRGEFLGIVGPNGSGKTTILRAILGLLKPARGTIARSGRPVIGYVPQREHIDTIVPVTAGEVVMMGRAPRLGPLARLGRRDTAAVEEALARVGVGELAPRLFRDLSGGQQQRVLLARALAAEPDLLVLDEPTSGMDLASEHALVELLVELNRRQGLTVLLVTHLLQTVLDAATSILLIDRGRVLYGDAGEVLREDRLAALYGLSVRLVEAGGRRTVVVGGRP